MNHISFRYATAAAIAYIPQELILRQSVALIDGEEVLALVGFLQRAAGAEQVLESFQLYTSLLTTKHE